MRFLLPLHPNSARGRNVLSTNRNQAEFAADRKNTSQNGAASMAETSAMQIPKHMVVALQ